jgi:DNA-binding NarL/FixJ family response regulator
MARRKKEFTVRAFSGAASANSTHWTQVARALANELFGKKKPYQPSPQEIADYYLTPREREVAYLAALGFSDVEIADALGMTFQTVRAHLRSILLKMALDDPRALCDYFLQRAASDSPDD